MIRCDYFRADSSRRANLNGVFGRSGTRDLAYAYCGLALVDENSSAPKQQFKASKLFAAKLSVEYRRLSAVRGAFHSLGQRFLFEAELKGFNVLVESAIGVRGLRFGL